MRLSDIALMVAVIAHGALIVAWRGTPHALLRMIAFQYFAVLPCLIWSWRSHQS
ncbi:MAG TPA: hypothetical protein VFA04_02830 [Bryobacteraceae bacterium]|nr:hypothetical protein [Bryobacteraceae bacterium]